MIKITLLLLTTLYLTGCMNKNGISAKYYSECKEYYNLQGFYHKECGEDDLISYEEIGELFKKEEEKPKGNVW